MAPSWKLAFRAGLWPDCYRENTAIGPLAGLRPAGGPISVFHSRNPAEILPGRPIYGPEALLRNILGWAGHLPDHLADLAARAPKLENVTVVAPRTT